MTEQARHHLFVRLVETLGEAEAVSLMDQFPPGGEDVVGTAYLDRRLEAFAAELRHEIRELRTELLGEIDGLRTELRGEIDGLRTELRGETRALRVEVADRLARHTRVTVLAVVTANAAIMGVVAAVLGTS